MAFWWHFSSGSKQISGREPAQYLPLVTFLRFLALLPSLLAPLLDCQNVKNKPQTLIPKQPRNNPETTPNNREPHKPQACVRFRSKGWHHQTAPAISWRSTLARAWSQTCTLDISVSMSMTATAGFLKDQSLSYLAAHISVDPLSSPTSHRGPAHTHAHDQNTRIANDLLGSQHQ